MNTALTIVLATDNNYFTGLVGTLSGILRRNASNRIKAVILDCGINEYAWAIFDKTFSQRYPELSLNRIKITSDQLKIFSRPKTKKRWSDAAYARLLLPDLLPNLDRILYLDCDLYVDTDLSPLFFAPLDGKPVAAVLDHNNPTLTKQINNREILRPEEFNLPAFNSGVMLIDLNMMRRTDFLATQIKHSKLVSTHFADQGVLNFSLRGQWKALPDRWNRLVHISDQYSTYRTHSDSIWHFVRPMKPWHFDPQFSRAIVADFQQDLAHCLWPQARSRNLKPSTPAWKDFGHRMIADLQRNFRRINPAEDISGALDPKHPV